MRRSSACSAEPDDSSSRSRFSGSSCFAGRVMRRRISVGTRKTLLMRCFSIASTSASGSYGGGSMNVVPPE